MHEVNVALNAREIQTLTAAMAGNHPEALNEYRMSVLRKLARASRAAESFAPETAQEGSSNG